MIKDLKTLREFFQKVKTPIFGVCVYAFDRLGPEEFLPEYRLLSLRYSFDTQLIEKDLEVLSLEKDRGIYHLNVPRNSTSVLSHPKTQEYLKKFEKPLILPYKSSKKMMEVARENQWIIAANPPTFGKAFLENKLKFREILKKIKVTVVPGEICPIEELDYPGFGQKYGLPFFLQHPLSAGGKGNFVVENKNDFGEALKSLGELKRKGEEVLVAKYIRGPSPSITGCVTKFGILSTSPQYQLLSIPELYNKPGCFGLFCGHDWAASDFDERVEKQAYEIVEKVGKYFAQLGYKGIFGLDFVLDQRTKRLYVTECNPRMLGSFPTITMAQIKNGEPPILGFHLLEFLGVDYQLDVAAINQAMRKKRKAAQMLLHNLTGKWAESTAEIQPGIYQLTDNRIKFLRSGYKLAHLRKKEEFLLTGGAPIKRSYFSPNRRLFRVLSLRRVTEDHQQLNPWAKRVVKLAYDSLGLRPIRFRWLKKLLNPKYLVKG